MLNTYINSLGENLAFRLFVQNYAQRMLGDIVDTSSVVGTMVGHSFLNSAQSLDVYNLTFLVGSPICGQSNNSMFSKRPVEHVGGSSPLSLCVSYVGEFWKMKVPDKKKELEPSIQSLYIFCLP